MPIVIVLLCLGVVASTDVSASAGWASRPLLKVRAWALAVSLQGARLIGADFRAANQFGQAGVANPVASPVIETDKTGYLAGETISISGSGFAADELVTVQVKHTNGDAEADVAHDPFIAFADGAGVLSATWALGDDAGGNSFVVIAAGQVSGQVQPAAFERIAVVGTDKYDYAPGETAIISGAGFRPGEVVTVQVVHSNGLNGGMGHEPFPAVAESDGRFSVTWLVDPDDSEGSIFRLTAIGADSGLLATSTFTDYMLTIFDDKGADDEPGQKDLNYLSVDYAAAGGIAVAWGWDDTAWSGNNSGDACVLFDTNQDGKANYSLCVVVKGKPAEQDSYRLYSCGNDRADRCSQPTTLISNFRSTATAGVVTNSDPFGTPGSSKYQSSHVSGNTCSPTPGCYTADTVANLSIALSDVGNGVAKLINVCSYPSQEPNSDPSECVITPNSGFLTIVKEANPNDGTPFTFNMGAGQMSTDGTSSWTINGSGTTNGQTLFPFEPGKIYDLYEVIPAGWKLTDVSCQIQSASPTSTGTSTATGIENFEIVPGLETICTFKDTQLPEIMVTKSASPTEVPESGGDVTFTYTVKNMAAAPAKITALSDDKFGTLAGDSDCYVGALLAGGASCDFTAKFWVEGDYPGTHVNVFTATAEDEDGYPAEDSDDATVTFTDVKPLITVTKDVDPTSVPETGGEVTYTYTVTNDSTEPVTITELIDVAPGGSSVELAGDDDCKLGTVLQPGETCGFSVPNVEVPPGDAGDEYTNTFEATVTDGDNNTSDDSDDATVTYTDVKPDITVSKSASPTSVPETGGSVKFTFEVKNNSSEAVTITALSDDKFGALAGDADCHAGTELAAGASCSFEATKAVPAGDYPGSHVNVFSATAQDNDGSSDTATDDATVTYTDVLPDITVSKSANPMSVPETGGSVTFTFEVKNNSSEAAKITALSDDKFGTLAGDADCQVGTELPGKASCSFVATFAVPAGDYPGSHVNVFSATVEDNDGNSDSASDQETVTYTDVKPDITVSKSANPTSVPETGGSVTFTFEVKNNSTEAATITALSDNKFGTMTGDADCQGGTVLAGKASCSFEATFAVPAGDYPGSHVNVFSATVSDEDGNTDTATDDATVAYTDVLPDITVSKSASPTSVPETGGSVTFTFEVKNNSSEAAKITALSDDKFGTLAGDADCKVGTELAGGASCSFEATLAVPAGDSPGSHVNVFTATVQDNDGNSDSASDNATVAYADVKPDINVAKSASPTSVPETGGSVTYEVVVTNNSLEAVTLTSLMDDKFGNLDGVGTCDVPKTIAAGGSYTCSFSKDLSGDPSTPHVNTVTAAGSDDDGNSDTASDSAEVKFDDVKPGINVTKSASPTSVPETGGSVTYTVVVTNSSLEAVTLTSLMDDKFGNLNGQGSCSVPKTISANGSYTCSFSKNVSGDAGQSHVNLVTAVGTDNDGNSDSAEDDAKVDFEDVLPNITVTKTAGVASVLEVGGPVTYTFVVKNNSAEAATITALSDDKFGALAGNAGCKVGTVLAGGASCSFNATFTLLPAKADHVNVFTATVTDGDDNNATDTDDAIVTYVNALPSLVVNKTASPKNLMQEGGTVTFTITITNKSVATDPVTLDSFSDSVYGDLMILDDGTRPQATVCEVAPPAGLAPGESYTCKFTVTFPAIPANTTFSETNVAQACGHDDEGSSGCWSDDATVTQSPPIALTNSSLCTFDMNPAIPGRQFRNLLSQNGQSFPYFEDTATNPGQFFYNLSLSGTPGDIKYITLTLPWPFVTQGNRPVHVYDSVEVHQNADKTFCFVPGETTAAIDEYVVLSDYGVSWIGGGYSPLKTHVVTLAITIPDTGFAYVNQHLDYGLKGPKVDFNNDGVPEGPKYAKGSGDDALWPTQLNDGNLGKVLIPELFTHTFSVSWLGGGGEDSVQNDNEFKRNPGVGGRITIGPTDTGTPVVGQLVTLWLNGSPVASAKTDEDGFYLIVWKHKGQAATYSVETTLPAGAVGITSKSVTLKANGVQAANFEFYPPSP